MADFWFIYIVEVLEQHRILSDQWLVGECYWSINSNIDTIWCEFTFTSKYSETCVIQYWRDQVTNIELWIILNHARLLWETLFLINKYSVLQALDYKAMVNTKLLFSVAHFYLHNGRWCCPKYGKFKSILMFSAQFLSCDYLVVFNIVSFISVRCIYLNLQPHFIITSHILDGGRVVTTWSS